MKSKISYSKLFWEIWRKQLWVFALTMLAFFISAPLYILLKLGNWETDLLLKDALRLCLMRSLYGLTHEGVTYRGEMHFFILALLAMAVVSAWQGLARLHSRAKTDFWYGLPLRREKLFLLHTLVGVMNYIISAGIMLVLVLVVVQSRGMLTLPVLGAVAGLWLTGLVFFLLAWLTAALAMLLTGQVLVGILGTGVFFLVGILIRLALLGYAGVFYTTWSVYPERSRMAALADTWFLSPMLHALNAMTMLCTSSGWLYTLAGIGIAALLFAVNLFLCKKRPAEAAGQAMAFPLVGEIIKVTLTVISALCIGLIFIYLQSGGNEDAWMVFGLVFGALLTYAIIQMIYHLDVRRLLQGKLALGCALVLSLGIAAFFRFDLSGYDTWLPAQDQVRALAFYSDGAQAYGSTIPRENLMEKMQLPVNEETYGLFRTLVEDNQTLKTTDPQITKGFYILARIELENGAVSFRNYRAPFQDVAEQVAGLYEIPQFRDSIYIADQVTPEQVINARVQLPYADSVYWEGAQDRQFLNELTLALQEDVKELTAQTILNEIPVGTLVLRMNLEELGYTLNYSTDWSRLIRGAQGSREGDLWSECCFLYPSFHRTLALLADQGIVLASGPDPALIQRITIFNYQGMGMYDDEPEQTVCETPEEIQALAPRLVYSEFATIWQDYDHSMDATVEMAPESALQGGSLYQICEILTETPPALHKP